MVIRLDILCQLLLVRGKCRWTNYRSAVMNEAGVLFAEGYVFQVGVELLVVINSKRIVYNEIVGCEAQEATELVEDHKLSE